MPFVSIMQMVNIELKMSHSILRKHPGCEDLEFLFNTRSFYGPLSRTRDFVTWGSPVNKKIVQALC